MAKALDRRGLEIYYRQLAFSQKIQEMIARIRGLWPNDALYSIRGSASGGYPSKEMGRIIQAESHKIEFPSILELEYSSEYEEVDFQGEIATRACYLKKEVHNEKGVRWRYL